MTKPAAVPPPVYLFADLALDVAQRRVFRQGRAIEISALNFELLRVLVESAPNVVTFDTLAENVWGRHFVSLENVAQRVMLLRQCLSDEASQPRYVEAVRSKGYRLIPSVQTASTLQPRTAPGRRGPVLAAAGLLTALALVALAAHRLTAVRENAQNASAALPVSVAVLPFEDMSPDPVDAYFAAGLHEEVLGRLEKIKALRVLSRTSMLRYQNTTLSIPEVAKELNGVTAVMEGSVRRDGSRIRVAVRLVDAVTDELLWERTYPREMKDIFALQSDIAANVATALEAEFSPAERARIEAAPTESVEAYALYLKAVGAGPAAALRNLHQATEIDPEFALAYAALAERQAFTLTNSNGSDVVPADRRAEVEAATRTYAHRAIGLDPHVPYAHTALGVLAHTSWRWTEAESHVVRAIEISPSDLVARNVYGMLLSSLGRYEQAIAVAEPALDLNPGDPNAGWYAFWLAAARHYDAAAAVLERAIAVDGTQLLVRDWLAFVEIARGNARAAAAQLALSESLAAGDRQLTFLPEWAYSYGRIGARDDATRIFEEIESVARAGTSPGAGGWAMAYLAIDDRQSALGWLETAAAKAAAHERDEGFYNLLILKMNVTNDAVLTRPEFVEVLSRIGGH